jgi:multicomponent Na+:H+ antiporter subunit C
MSDVNIVTLIGVALLLVGFHGALSRPNIVKMIVGFAIADTGVNMIIVAVGYLPGRTAPILDSAADAATAAARMVDPVPQALVLTAIVIGLAVTALMLSYAVRMRRAGGSMSIESYGEQKW